MGCLDLQRGSRRAARDELQVYLDHPDDPRFHASALVAAEVRRKEQDLNKQFHKNFREVSDLWAAPGVRRRPLTSLLIAASVVVFLLQRSSLYSEWVDEQMLFTTFHLDAGGTIRDDGLEPVLHGEVWRLVTPILMHVNIPHIFFNMWWLSALGTMIEIRRGTLRLAGLVLIAAVISNLGQYLYDVRIYDQARAAQGMSGVIYALFGYIWMKGLHEPEQGMVMHPNNINIMMLWLVICMTGVVGPIANAAHVTGLVVGVTLGIFRY